MKRNIIITLLSISVIFLFNSCSTVKNITQTLLNLEKLQFRLENVNGFSIAGIGLKDKNSLSDFSIMDGVKLVNAYETKSFPAEFILNVAAKNPNDGTGGLKQASATLASLEWQLYIDDVPTIAGVTTTPVEIPGTGQSTIIPIKISLDLYKFFNDKGYNSVINLALAIGGVKGSAARLKLDAKPTVTTQFGNISYPGRITIIDKKFSS